MTNGMKWAGVGIVARRDQNDYVTYHPAIVRKNGEVKIFFDGFVYQETAENQARREAEWGEVPYLGYVSETL